MKPEKFKHYTSLQIADNNAIYDIQIQNDCSQFIVESNDGDEIFIDTNKKELIALRDMLTTIIEDN